MTILTDDQVIEIYRNISGETYATVSDRYKISAGLVFKIRHAQGHYRHIIARDMLQKQCADLIAIANIITNISHTI